MEKRYGTPPNFRLVSKIFHQKKKSNFFSKIHFVVSLRPSRMTHSGPSSVFREAHFIVEFSKPMLTFCDPHLTHSGRDNPKTQNYQKSIPDFRFPSPPASTNAPSGGGYRFFIRRYALYVPSRPISIQMSQI
jgi:hypothetical protein